MRERGMRNMLGKGLSSCLGFAENSLYSYRTVNCLHADDAAFMCALLRRDTSPVSESRLREVPGALFTPDRQIHHYRGKR